jgi:hypothetical protein
MHSNVELKNEYIKYYQDVPVQRYAAMFIAKDEDTIIRWRKEDSDFADAVLKAKAEWIRKKVIATKAEFALERLEKSVFSQNSTIEVEVSAYDNFVANNQIDPNAPNAKALSNRICEILMEETKAK